MRPPLAGSFIECSTSPKPPSRTISSHIHDVCIVWLSRAERRMSVLA
jgi:hypothetical protein